MREMMDAKEIAELEVKNFSHQNIEPVEIDNLISDHRRLRAENEALKRKWDNLDSHTQVVINHQNEQIADLTRQRDEAQQLADTIERAYRREERQNAAMRSALNDAEFIMGDEFGAEWRESFPAFAETLAALQPAPEPITTEDPDADTGTEDDLLPPGFALSAEKVLQQGIGTPEWIKHRAAKLGITPAEWAKAYCDITPEQVRALRREQAISFAYGNVKMHNPDLTRESVAAEYDKLNSIQPAPEPKV